MEDVDLILFLVDASLKLGPGDQYIIESLKQNHVPVFLVLNKIDKLKKNRLWIK